MPEPASIDVKPHGTDFDAWQARFSENHEAAPVDMLPAERTIWAEQRTNGELGPRSAPPVDLPITSPSR